ncbi:MAG: hypothetical protein M3Z46_07160 [Actinomycetota bacterium]|nr:hypothetical protein [Actinomycetota bacterium]
MTSRPTREVPDASDAAPPPHAQVEFAHNSERQFAKLLDFYEIEWAYEPRTFVLETGPDGLPTLAFSPDFHLPRFDLYIEVTTLNQKLVTKKNRKLRLMAERHPEVQVRLLYQRDYLELLVKYGLESPDQLRQVPGATSETAGEELGLLGLGALPRPAASRSTRQHPAA